VTEKRLLLFVAASFFFLLGVREKAVPGAFSFLFPDDGNRLCVQGAAGDALRQKKQWQ